MIIASACGSKEKNSVNDFVFEDGNKKVELKILNGKNYLDFNEPTKIRIELINYNDNKFAVSGMGIEKLSSTKTNMDLEIKPTESTMTNGHMEIKTTILVGDEKVNYEFKIPVKTK